MGEVEAILCAKNDPVNQLQGCEMKRGKESAKAEAQEIGLQPPRSGKGGFKKRGTQHGEPPFVKR